MSDCEILIVDDEVAFLETVIKRLRRRKLRVRSAHSGKEALRCLEQAPVDVVVLDVKMPGMDGIQVLREIKSRHPLVEVIMLTGHASVDSAIEGMELGAFDYLMKPLELEELIYKIQDAYGRKSIQEAKIRSLEG
jgi:DNA-binding NtrC family response regulator